MIISLTRIIQIWDEHKVKFRIVFSLTSLRFHPKSTLKSQAAFSAIKILLEIMPQFH